MVLKVIVRQRIGTGARKRVDSDGLRTAPALDMPKGRAEGGLFIQQRGAAELGVAVPAAAEGEGTGWGEPPAKLDPEEQERLVAGQLEHLHAMRRYAQAARCRHAALSEYFGQPYAPRSCGACDVCLGETESLPESTLVAQKLLSCVARTGARFGVRHVAEVLRGMGKRRLLVPMPVAVIRLVATVSEKIKLPFPVATDQLRQLKYDNIGPLDGYERAFGVPPRAMDGQLGYLRRKLRDQEPTAG